MRRSPCSAALVSVLLLGVAPSAGAAITVYTSQASFLAAAPTATLQATFESHAAAAIGPFTEGGLGFSSSLGNMYIISAGAPGETVPLPTSKMLSANGQEDIVVTVNIGWTTAIGFTLLTNQYGPHTVTLTNPQNVAFYTYHPTQAPNTVGFVGFVSDDFTTRISSLHWVADRGNLQNTALDNFYWRNDAVPVARGSWGRMKDLYR